MDKHPTQSEANISHRLRSNCSPWYTAIAAFTILMSLQSQSRRAMAAPLDSPIWQGPRFRDLALIEGKAMAFDDLRCKLFEIDLRTGEQLPTRALVTHNTESGDSCPDRLLGNALLIRDPQRDIVIEPLSHKPLAHLVPPRDVENRWLNTGAFIVAVEHFTAHMRKLPQQHVRAFSRATGQLAWTTLLPDGYDTSYTLAFDNDNLYVLLSPFSSGPAMLVALRLKDGSTAWHSEQSYLRPCAGQAGVLIASSKIVTLLAPQTGSARWQHVLPEYVMDAVVSADRVHILYGEFLEPKLLTLAASDGHELWRTALPGAPNLNPRNPQGLFATPNRVFCIGHLNERGSLLSGYDATTGAPTLSYWLASNSHIGQFEGSPNLIWGPHVPSFKTVAFDPNVKLQARPWEVSGTVSHHGKSLFRGKSLEGIQVCSFYGCVRTNRRGGFTLRGESRGELPIWLYAYDWINSLTRFAPKRPGFTLSYPDESIHINLEIRTSEAWNPRLNVKLDPVEMH